jgi:recombination protein RecA
MASIVPNNKMSLKEKLKLLDTVASKTNKKYGKILMGRIGKTPEIMDKLIIKFIPTPSSVLNRDLGGGIPRARCSIITGDPDSGKTSLLLESIAVNMKADPEFTAGWLESEHSLEKSYIIDTFHIDPNRFFFIPLDLEIGTEKTLDIVEGLIATGAVDMFCINSLRCLVPDKEREKEMGDVSVAEQARLNAKMMRKWTGLIAQYETAFCVVQHETTNIGGYGSPKVLAGGEAYKYWASVILRLSKHSIQAGDPIEKNEGHKIGYVIRKNHCTPGAKRQYCKGEYYVRFGEGTDEVAPSIDIAIEAGILERHGAWLWWMTPGEEEPRQKFKSKAHFIETMKADEALWKEFYALIQGDIAQESLNAEEIAEIEAEEKKLQEKADETEKLLAEVESEPVEEKTA